MKRDQAQPPADVALEADCIGACLGVTDPDMQAAVLQVLGEDCFTSALWRDVWRAIADAWRAGDEADMVLVARTVGERTKRDGNDVHAALVGQLADGNPLPWFALPRAKALRDLAVRRELIEIARESTVAAYRDSDAAGVLAYTARLAELLDAADAREETGEIDPIADEVERLAESGEAIGWSIGLPAYDGWSGGMRPGEVHVIGGPSGIGKTWLLGQIANAAVDVDKSVAFVSLEMGQHEIYTRLVAGRIGMIAYRLAGRARTWAADEYAAYREARATLAGSCRLYCDQRSVEQIEAVVRRTQPDVLVVDYLQLVDWPKGATSEYAALTQVANSLQRLAKRAGCTAVLATQMARAYQTNTDGAVQGGMGSGRIDQVADLWVLIRSGEMEGEVKLTCRKNRHGPSGGEIVCRLDAARGRFVQ